MLLYRIRRKGTNTYIPGGLNNKPNKFGKFYNLENLKKHLKLFFFVHDGRIHCRQPWYPYNDLYEIVTYEVQEVASEDIRILIDDLLIQANHPETK